MKKRTFGQWAWFCAGLLTVVGALSAPAAGQQEGRIRLVIDDIAVDQGDIMVALFDSADRYERKVSARRVDRVPVRDGRAEVTFDDLPYGTYAFMLFQDVNGNRRMDRSPSGLPIEPIAFSNQVRGKFGLPPFSETGFRLDGPETIQQVTLRGVGSHWAVGIGAVMGPKPYENSKGLFIPFPALGYVGERFYLQGIRGGYHLLQRNRLALDVIAGVRFDGYRADDADVLDGMSTRKHSFDMGLRGEYGFGENWMLRLDVVSDVVGVHNGQEGRLVLQKKYRKEKWAFSPFGGVHWLSSKLGNYYYGVRANEARPGRPEYVVNNAASWEAGLNTSYFMNEDWMFMAGFRLTGLTSEIQDSPIVADGFNTRLFLAALYHL